MGPHGELVFIWPSGGATGHPRRSLKPLSEQHLSAYPEQWLAPARVHPLWPPRTPLCGIPLWRRGQANTCAILQCSGASYRTRAKKSPGLEREQLGQSVVLGGAEAALTGGGRTDGGLISSWAATADTPPITIQHSASLSQLTRL